MINGAREAVTKSERKFVIPHFSSKLVERNGKWTNEEIFILRRVINKNIPFFVAHAARIVGFHRQASLAHSAFIRFRRDEPPSSLFGNLIPRQFLRPFAAVDQI